MKYRFLQYDSGGPVLWQDPSTRRLVHVGIISYGNTCADGNPAVNSRVGSYLNWIYQQKPTGNNILQLLYNEFFYFFSKFKIGIYINNFFFYSIPRYQFLRHRMKRRKFAEIQ